MATRLTTYMYFVHPTVRDEWGLWHSALSAFKYELKAARLQTRAGQEGGLTGRRRREQTIRHQTSSLHRPIFSLHPPRPHRPGEEQTGRDQLAAALTEPCLSCSGFQVNTEEVRSFRPSRTCPCVGYEVDLGDGWALPSLSIERGRVPSIYGSSKVKGGAHSIQGTTYAFSDAGPGL